VRVIKKRREVKMISLLSVYFLTGTFMDTIEQSVRLAARLRCWSFIRKSPLATLFTMYAVFLVLLAVWPIAEYLPGREREEGLL